MFRLYKSLTLLLIMQSSVTFADELEDASIRLCEHVKVCITKQLNITDDISSDMRIMIDGIVENMCQSMMNTSAAQGNQDFEKSAIACIDSIIELGCDNIQNAGETTQCLAFEQELTTRFPSEQN